MLYVKFTGSLAAIFFSLIAAEVQAALITFTDSAAFSSSSGPLTSVDFDSEAIGDFADRDFGDFNAFNVNINLNARISGGGQNTNIDGSNHLSFRTFATQSPLELIFDFPIFSFGFDFVTTDPTDDGLDLVINGELFNVALAAPESGFFGIIETGPVGFTTVGLQDDTDGGGNNVGVGLDNLHFSSGAVAVSEPATLLTIGLGLAGIGMFIRRRHRA